MPNRRVHVRAGGVAGGGYAAYHAWGLPPAQVLAETVGGVVGGVAGGVLPDAIDVPTVRVIARQRTAWVSPAQ
jgi:hypothetical protein